MEPKVKQLLSDMLITEMLITPETRRRLLETLLENERGKSHTLYGDGYAANVSDDYYRILSVIAQDNKIKAIKLLRDYCVTKRLGLKASKDMVEQIMREGIVQPNYVPENG